VRFCNSYPNPLSFSMHGFLPTHECNFVSRVVCLHNGDANYFWLSKNDRVSIQPPPIRIHSSFFCPHNLHDVRFLAWVCDLEAPMLAYRISILHLP
jgi:hypothetical protein